MIFEHELQAREMLVYTYIHVNKLKEFDKSSIHSKICKWWFYLSLEVVTNLIPLQADCNQVIYLFHKMELFY